jgi:hypothetical protein
MDYIKMWDTNQTNETYAKKIIKKVSEKYAKENIKLIE